MIVKVVPRLQAIHGVLPKNKPINGPEVLDLNPREINYCMSLADVYDENDNLITSRIPETYTGADMIIKNHNIKKPNVVQETIYNT